MDFLIEEICGLIFDGIVEISKSKKVPKYIRYPLIAFIMLFCIAVFGIMLYADILALKENIFLGIILIALTLFMLVLGIIKFRKGYLNRKNKE